MITSIRIRIVIACTLVIAATGCERAPGKPGADSEVLRPEEELRFDVLYRKNCAGCHGADGQNGAALDLANPLYQDSIDDSSLRKWIESGMPQTQMPAFAVSAGGPLTDKQIDALVVGMRKQWARAALGRPEKMPAYPQPVDADASRGGQVFIRSCSSCHRASKQEIMSPDYLALVSDQGLRTLVVSGRPDIGQPDWQHADPHGALSDQDVSDVVGFLGSLRISTPGQPYPGRTEGKQ